MMPTSSFHDEPWYQAAEAERMRFRELRRRLAENRERAGTACRGLDAVLDEARRLLVRSRAERSARVEPPQRSVPERDTLAQAMRRVGLAEEDLPDFLDGLIAAYQDAVAVDDDAAVATLGQALKTVGWHLANEMGPRIAGVTLN